MKISGKSVMKISGKSVMKISGISAMKRIMIYAVLTITLVAMFMLTPLVTSSESNNQSNISSNITNTTLATYRVDVDQDYGFYKVTDMKISRPAPYDKINRTLTIRVGDTVIWENDATPDEPLTIMSKEELWGNRSAYLRWNYQKFSYTFNQSGTYEMYIKEYPREQHQIVIVEDIAVPKVTVTVSAIPTITNTVFPNTAIGENTTPTETILPKKEEAKFPIEAVIAIIALIAMIVYLYRKGKK